MTIRIRRLHLAASLVLGLALSPALAPSPAAAQGGTPAQRAACENDAMRVCGQYIPDVAQITSCMRRNCRSLSHGCRAVMHCGKRRR
jgi:hypothetical protein